ncbi:MAG: TIGR01777 family oxidoreductase [Solirubrobacterales bacterium]
MRVLVTGASGLIGSALCDALLARGDEVVGLTRDPIKARPKNPTVHWHAWEPTTEPPPPEALDQVDAVVNLVGEEINQRLTDKAKVRIRESRLLGTRNLLQGIQASPTEPSVFVGQSAIGYYGDRGAQVLDEESAPGEGFTAEIPVDWEAAEREAEDVVDRVVIFRTGLVLTKEGGLLKQLLLPFRLGVGGPIAGGEQFMSWIHVDDEVGLILWALDDHSVWGIINATAPNPVTNREFSKALGRALRRPAVFPVPKLAVTAMRGRELADAVAGGARVLPRRALDLGYEFRHPEIDEALRSALR